MSGTTLTMATHDNTRHDLAVSLASHFQSKPSDCGSDNSSVYFVNGEERRMASQAQTDHAWQSSRLPTFARHQSQL